MASRKKFFSLLAILMLALCGTQLFASIHPYKGNDDIDTSDWIYEGIADKPYHYVDGRLERLGGTGNALSTGVSSLFYNPANLANEQGFTLHVPSIEVRLFNLIRMRNYNEFLRGFVDEKLLKFNFNDINYYDLLTNISECFGTQGISPLLDVNVDIGFTVKGFGFDVFGGLGGYIYNKTGVRIQLVGSLGVAFGYGHQWTLSPKTKLSFGASVSLLSRIYTQGINVDELAGVVAGGGDFGAYINKLRISHSLEFPINLGINAKFLDCLNVSASITGLNFLNKIYSYGTFEDMKSNIASLLFSGFKYGKDSQVYVGRTSMTPDFTVGFAYNPKWKWFNPRVEIDFVNLFNYKTTEFYDYKTFLAHFRVGVELSLVEFLRVGVGLNQGCLTFGATIDLWPIIIEANFGWVDTTNSPGTAMSDYFSVAVRLGWDRKK